jgi:hypothetical protein
MQESGAQGKSFVFRRGFDIPEEFMQKSTGIYAENFRR